jgi:hypothetical protein
VAGADEVEDEAVAEAGARTEAEAASERVTGVEAVTVAEAGGAGRYAADERGQPGEQPREAAAAAYSPWCLLFTEAGRLKVCGLPLLPLWDSIGRPSSDNGASRALLLVSGHR